MAKRILGGYDVTHNATANGVRTVQSINGNAGFDAQGNMIFDGYTQNEIEKIISVLPISHYGTHNYLPAGVSGSFDGAAENISARRIKLQLDNDGTLVFLRPGTNGSTVGVYYAYLPNALKTTNLTSSVNTNREYRPGYFSSTEYAISIIASDRGIVAGMLNDNTTVFTSLTKGTLDDRQHVGFKIPLTTVQPADTELNFVMLGTDGYIYYFATQSTSNQYSLALTRVQYNPITGAVIGSPVRITGFNNNTFYGDVINGTDNILLNNVILSKNIADKPYALIPNASIAANPYMASFDVFAAQDSSTGNIRIKINGDMWCTTTTYNTRPQHGYSYVFNPNTKINTLDSGYDRTTTPAPITITDTGTSLSASGSTIVTDVFYAHVNTNLATTYFYSPEGLGICVSTPNLGEPPYIQIADFTPAKVYDMINQKVFVAKDPRIGRLNQSFGSPISNNINSIVILPNNRTLQVSRDGDGQPNLSVAQHGTTPNFTFKSYQLGTIQGYEPTTNRFSIPNISANKGLISTVSNTNSVVNGGILAADFRTNTALSFNENMITSGSISIANNLLTTLRDSEFSKVSSTWDLSPGASRDLVLYVPQQSNIPAFAVISTVSNTNLSMYVRVVEVNVNTRSGTITSLSFSRLVTEYLLAGNLDKNARAYLSQHSMTGISIYDMGSYYFIGGGSILTYKTIGNSTSMLFRAVVDKNTGQFIRFNSAGTHADYENGDLPGVLPGYGFGIFTPIDFTTKIIFRQYGTNLTDYDTWAEKSVAPIAVVTQDVAQGFILYFTENTPVLLSGKSFTLPIQTVDLRNIKANPANTTFNVYVRMYQGNAEYYISEEIVAESGSTAYNLLWIGQITTNATQISTINIMKRSRLDVFGQSLESRGSSFPVSYGLPSSGGTINW